MFVLRSLDVGRLHISLGYNPSLPNNRHVLFNRLDGLVFFTLRLGHRFINIDWA